MRMTASMLQAYDWYVGAPASWKDRAWRQLVGMFTDTYTDSAGARRGREYEDIINHEVETGSCRYPELTGAVCQKWLSPYAVNTKYGLMQFRGRIDYARTGVLYDLKTTMSYDPEQYRAKWQHVVYCLAERTWHFVYLVALFPDKTGLEPIATARVPCVVAPEDEQRLRTHIEEMLGVFKERRVYNQFLEWAL